MKHYIISVVIPIYNQEKDIDRCIKTLKRQTMEFSRIEIILINDGSTDKSPDICRYWADKYSNIVFLTQDNCGVSCARNAGIKVASGKYIFYLDADDSVEKNTFEKVSLFFDSVYDEVDLVTYKIETTYNGKLIQPHFRYQYLIDSGVYDLETQPYIGQTTMNIVVKNKFDDNLLFDTDQTFSEDQKYCCEILQNKLKMGFCDQGLYIYYRSDSSSSGKMAGACYIFEQCISMFEKLFYQYKQVPAAFQGLFVNDIYWKLRENILFPYHYENDKYIKAVERIRKLFEMCDDQIILDHPAIDFFEKYYLITLKRNNLITTDISSQGFDLYDNGRKVVHESSMEIVITKLGYHRGQVYIDGFIKSVFLIFYKEEPMVCAVENDGRLVRKLKLSDSTHNYYLSHEKTQHFKSFQYRCKPEEVRNVRFEVELGGYWFPTHFYFMPLISLSHQRKKFKCKKIGLEISLNENNNFLFRQLMNDKQDQIWLYYDCSGLSCDNGMLQYEHDICLKDGIQRYYVVTDPQQLSRIKNNKNQYVMFGSRTHKQLLKKCTKILTGYIEEENLIPYERKNYFKFAQNFSAEVIYLQHGVLHIIMPWKYSRETILADRVVVSTEEEADLYKENGYNDDDLIKTGMPRFEKLKRVNKEKKILFAPSWRKYLVGGYSGRRWKPLEEKFINSRFFQEMMIFLNSPKLDELLEKTGYELDVKLHPIFSMYAPFFHWDCSRIKFADPGQEDGSYDFLITDFSSYAFNFSYLSIPVLYFIPDIDEFKCGMNGYRELNYPNSFWENVATDNMQIIARLEKAVLYGDIIEPEINFYKCHKIRETIYQEIVRKNKGDKDE